MRRPEKKPETETRIKETAKFILENCESESDIWLYLIRKIVILETEIETLKNRG